MAFDASAQFGLGCRRVVEEGLADGEQLAFQGHLGGAPPLGLGMSAGFGPVVNPVDGVGPPGQPRPEGRLVKLTATPASTVGAICPENRR